MSTDLSWFPPELLVSVFSALSPHDQAQCVRVSRAWSAISIPQLWRRITIVTPRAFRRFLTEEAQTALARNAHLVRIFMTIYFPIVESIVRRSPESDPATSEQPTAEATLNDPITCMLTNLLMLDLGTLWRTPLPPAQTPQEAFAAYSGPLPSPPLSSDQEELIRHLIQSNPRLKCLNIGGYIQHCDALLGIITNTNLPNLQYMSLLGDHGGMSPWRDHEMEASPSFEAAKRFLENSPQSLKSVSGRLNASVPTSDQLVLHDTPEPCLPHHSLEFVRIYAPFIESEQTIPDLVQQHLFSKFFQSCGQNLKDVQTPHEEHLRIESLRTILAKRGFGANKVLRLEGQEAITDEAMALELAKEPDWTRIDFSTCDIMPQGRLTANALLERCGSLEDLDISTCEGVFTSQDLAELLAKSPKLIKLIASLDHMSAHGWPRNPQLEAQDFIWTPWVCTSLVYLEIQLVGVPRPDVKFGHDGRPVEGGLFRGTVEWSRQIQRLIYYRLAELKNLIHLKLGHCPLEPQPGDQLIVDTEGRLRPLDDEFQLNCLEMSLASGLDMLAGMTQMKVLDLTRCCHNVGIAELEWMQKHWPQLERISGLFDDWYPALQPGVYEWLVENDPAWAWEYRDMQFSEDHRCGGILLRDFAPQAIHVMVAEGFEGVVAQAEATGGVVQEEGVVQPEATEGVVQPEEGGVEEGGEGS
ncbi:hypothetical protein BG006_008908 [Podila minutissima]|uniref:F-box domain-containing protein n=1 Tax=Podila minutissima TaxID=64525 RepID=A0A9P5SJG7_9FUNG|nr:hypothetical protein BG006_008908 [Podila minutissima]